MIVYLTFLILSVIWLLILFIGPYLLKFHCGYNFLIRLYYALFRLTCHQMPERSYFIWGYQMPVCVRCFGIYLGIVIGLLIYPFFRKLSSTEVPKFKYLWFILTPIFVDGIAQALHLYPSPHYVRLLTGILASSGLVFYAMPLFTQVYIRIRSGRR